MSTIFSIDWAKSSGNPWAVLLNASLSLALVTATFGIGKGLMKRRLNKALIARAGGAPVDTAKYNDLDPDTAKIRNDIMLQGGVFLTIAVIFIVLVSGGYYLWYWYTNRYTSNPGI